MVLAGLAATSVAGAAKAEEPRPKPRPQALGRAQTEDIAAILARSGLAEKCGFVLSDLATGKVIQSHNPSKELPPASVAKIMTALYGLEGLGRDYRFHTRVAATGPIREGTLEGDLILVGSGDPTLDTDRLAELAGSVAARGVRRVSGRYLVAANALPYHREIEPSQPEFVSYNPAISGCNLNFNRVHFQWRRGQDGYALAMTARAERHDTPVQGVDMQVVNRVAPVFTYEGRRGRDAWTVSAQALGRDGSRWLPVRTPERYSGEVFRTLAYDHGLRLPPFETLSGSVRGTEIAAVESPQSATILRDMLKYSNNLTAEVIGLTSAQRLGHGAGSIRDSAGEMALWLRRSHGVSRIRVLNHSGLTEDTHISAAELVQILRNAQRSGIAELLRDHPLSGPNGEKAGPPGVAVVAKTGTMNFIRGLSGYITIGSGRRFGFAILSADPSRRSPDDGIERPAGAGTWMAKAKEQERALLWYWAHALSA